MILELEGYEAHGMSCGEEALDFLTEESADLIFLDLNTDGITAHEFMQKLEVIFTEKAVKRPLVGVLSGSAGIDFETRRIGAEFSLRKPFGQEDVLNKLQQIMRQVKSEPESTPVEQPRVEMSAPA